MNMALTIGTKLGPYEILSPLGAGGMGEVYRARDTKLGREVALKVLPEAFASDAERLGRFEREAKLLASLNHINIAAIYGFEESSSTTAPGCAPTSVRALVMELVEGQTLAEMIAAEAKGARAGVAAPPKALSVDEALPIAKQIAEGLEYAHERGIVHRDLKPANVKITPDGVVKILDFGLAKALAGETAATDPSTSPTLSHLATQAGIILGTAAYMSPEQAKGKPVDRRADIWAFGCVLYEMLTGKPAFGGETVTDILAAVVTKEPDWGALPTSTPAHVRVLLQRCLRRDPKQRLRDIGDARIALEEVLSGVAKEQIASVGPTLPVWRRALPWAVAAFCALLAAAVVMLRGSGSRLPLMQTSIVAPEGTQFETMYRNGAPALSPDGTRVAFIASKDGRNSIWIRDLAKSEARQLPGTEGAFYPFWSPDGRSIGFFMNHKLWRMDLSSGTPMPVCDVVEPRGGSWSSSNVIIFAREVSGPIYRVSASGGTAKAVTGASPTMGQNSEQSSDRWPFVLPDGKHFLYLHTPTGNVSNQDEIRFGSMDGSAPKTLLRGRFYTVQYASGWLLADMGGSVKAWKFDPENGAVSGDGVNVANGVTSDDIVASGAFSVSRAGLFLYQHASSVATGDRQVWVDATGKQLAQISNPGSYGGIRLSPGGSRLATPVGDPMGGGRLWVWDLGRGARAAVSPETRGFGYWNCPVWSPKGGTLYFSNFANDIEVVPADGSAPPKVLLKGADDLAPADITADGKFLLYVEWKPAGGSGNNAATLKLLPLQGGGQQTTLLRGVDPASNARLKPGTNDWLAFQASDSGRSEVYLTKFPHPAAKYQVSQDGGTQPVWSRDGKTLYYLNASQQLVSVSVQAAGDSVQLGAPKVLFQTGVRTSITSDGYDVGRDGRFLLVNSLFTNAAPLTLVTDWTAELKK
jgi:serine/threonine protein kinase/Tol biopolymer transport system component